MGARPTRPTDSAFAVITRNARVLVVRARGKRRWQLPGGHLEQGEKHWDAANREVHEETGLRAEIVGLSGVYGRSDGTRAVVFVARVPGGVRVRGARCEIAEQRWVRIAVARRMLKRSARRRMIDGVAAADGMSSRRARKSELRSALEHCG